MGVNSSNLDLSVIPCDLVGHVEQVESPSETLAIASVVDERASHNSMNKEGISAEITGTELTRKRGGGEESLADQQNKCLTHISRRTAGCGHDTACSLNLRQSEVTDHNFRVFVHTVIQQILWLQRQEEASKRTVCKGRKGQLQARSSSYIPVFLEQ